MPSNGTAAAVRSFLGITKSPPLTRGGVLAWVQWPTISGELVRPTQRPTHLPFMPPRGCAKIRTSLSRANTPQRMLRPRARLWPGVKRLPVVASGSHAAWMAEVP